MSTQALWQLCTGQGASTESKTCFSKVSQPFVPWMTVCLKSSSRSLGKKQSILSHVISQRSEYPVRESALWNIPAVSITSSIFFRDSGMASSCNQKHSSSHRECTYSNEEKPKTADGLSWKQRSREEIMEQNGFGIKRLKKKPNQQKYLSSSKIDEWLFKAVQHHFQHLTSKSLEPACMYLSMKSRIVSHRAAKVVNESRGERCCRNTYKKTKP